MDNITLIQSYLRLKNISVTELVKAMKIGRSTFYYQLNKEDIDAAFARKFKENAGISITEILEQSSKAGQVSNGNENITHSERAKSNPRLEAVPKRLYADPLDHEDKKEKIINLPDGTMAMRVPIVPARAYAGYMRGFADPEYYDDLDDILIGVDKEPNGTYIGFEVVGDSMICLDTVELAEDSIFQGRIAIGRDLPQDSWKTKLHTHNYKNWIFVHKTEGILIKQIANHDVENGIVTIHSLNPKYADEDLRLEDMQQIFSVIQIVQRTRPKMK